MAKYDYLVVGAGLYGAVFAHEAREYYGSNVPLFRRNGYRQSGTMIP